MRSKKNANARLEEHRGLFFLSGLALSLWLAIVVIQWQTEISYKVEIPAKRSEVVTVVPVVPITHAPVPEKPEPKVKQKNAEIFKVVDKLVKLKLSALEPAKQDLEKGSELATIGINKTEEIEVIAPFAVERMAVPFACAELSDKEAQEKCLNQWMIRYLKDHVKYPEIAKSMRLEDKVFVTFVITHEGKVESIKVNNGEYEVLNEEAARVISELPLFRPASHYGKTVKMSMVQPINFRLQ